MSDWSAATKNLARFVLFACVYVVRLCPAVADTASAPHGTRLDRPQIEPTTDVTVGRSPTTTYEAYRFDLLEGARNPVCRAYQKRLNITEFHSPPYCGRPENDSVPGFSYLRRVPLTPGEVNTLFERVRGFDWNNDQGSRSQDLLREDDARRRGVSSPFESRENIESWLRQGQIAAWTYEPEVDLDNDGHNLTELVIWQGMPISRALGNCGTAFRYDMPDSDLQAQQGFYAVGDMLDEPRTRRTFMRSVVGARAEWLGVSFGVFAYQRKYYFDTFVAPTPSERRGGKKDLHYLSIFEREDDVTKQICRYSMRTIAPKPPGAVKGQQRASRRLVGANRP